MNNYVCPVCQKAFESIIDYAAHVNTHVEERKAKEAEKQLARQQEYERDSANVKELYNVYKSSYVNYVNAKSSFERKYGVPAVKFIYNLFDII